MLAEAVICATTKVVRDTSIFLIRCEKSLVLLFTQKFTKQFGMSNEHKTHASRQLDCGTSDSTLEGKFEGNLPLKMYLLWLV